MKNVIMGNDRVTYFIIGMEHWGKAEELIKLKKVEITPDFNESSIRSFYLMMRNGKIPLTFAEIIALEELKPFWTEDFQKDDENPHWLTVK